MTETLNIESKSSRLDEYLKWVCGFANANDGTIFIGKDDSGNVVGILDSKRLTEKKLPSLKVPPKHKMNDKA